MMRKLQLAFATALTFGISQVATTAYADNSALGVDPIFPTTQIDTKTGYYDLNVAPGQEQSLEMTLLNDGDKPMRVHVSANPASTNDNGVIEYGQNKIAVDESLTANVGKMISVPATVWIPAHGTKKFTAKLHVQEQRFNGIAVGGISFVTDADKGRTQNSGVQINNRYAYDMGVVLHESPAEIAPSLNMHQVRPTTVNYHTAIKARLQNDKPAFITDMTSHAAVYTAKDHKQVLSEDKKNQKVAPNSHFDYTMMLADGQKLAPGKYLADIDLTAKQGHWHFKQSFMVTAEKARTLDQQNITISHWAWWQIALLILLIILLAILIMYLVRRDRKRTAELRRLQFTVSEVTKHERHQN